MDSVHAAAGGARFVQVHALNATGRARTLRADEVPDDVELAAALAVAQLAGYQQGLPVLVRHRRPGRQRRAAAHDIHPRFRLGRIIDTSLTALLGTWHANGRAAGLAALAFVRGYQWPMTAM